jgi:hypothetical protein
MSLRNNRTANRTSNKHLLNQQQQEAPKTPTLSGTDQTKTEAMQQQQQQPPLPQTNTGQIGSGYNVPGLTPISQRQVPTVNLQPTGGYAGPSTVNAENNIGKDFDPRSGQQASDNQAVADQLVENAGAIEAAAGGAEGSGGDIDAMIEEWLRGQLGGARDTSEEEELLRQAAEAMMGRGVTDSRARMGRMGFGASGAMGALEGDIRTEAARGLGQDIFGLRRDARQEELERARAAMQGAFQMRGLDQNDAKQQAIMDMYKELMGQMGGGGGDDGGDPINDLLGNEPITGDSMTPKGPSPILARPPGTRSYDGFATGSIENPNVVTNSTDVPRPRTSIGNGVYQGGDGQYYRVEGADIEARSGGVGSKPATGLFDAAPWLNPMNWGASTKVS